MPAGLMKMKFFPSRGLDPRVNVFTSESPHKKTWMAGSGPAKGI
jgi:hypothetical protein